MLKREIKYEDFDGNEVTEVFYFNLSKPELIELEVEQKGGLSAWIEGIVKSNDNKEIIAAFKKLVLLAYGEKSEDGKRFVKNDEIREDFSHTAAYQALFMDLAMNAGAAADFVKGVLPRDMVKDVDVERALSAVPPTTEST